MEHTRILKQATIILGGTILALTLAASVAFAEYVKKPVTAQQRIEAKCNMMALNSMNGFDIWGDAIVAYGVKNNCMNAAGYVWKRPARAAKSKTPAAGTNPNK